MNTDLEVLADKLGLYVAAEPDDDRPWAVYDNNGNRVEYFATLEAAESGRLALAEQQANLE